MSAQPPGAGIVIAIDGPSGAGKSSTSRGVARARRARYLDTGAMYRAVTWWMLRHGVDTADADAVAARTREPRLRVGTDPEGPTITVDGESADTAIRTEEVTRAVSAVSAVPEVRARLVAEQQRIIAAARREVPGGIVVEGRDIATAVAPDAEVRVFLTASQQARAERRSAELRQADVTATQRSLARRDALDSSRAASPLRRAEGVVELDTTGFTLDEVIEQILAAADEAAPGRDGGRTVRGGGGDASAAAAH